ncbi:hypothetical protein VTN31DRAFT_2177 [Thermomyces dupontii]|uniref:uncharacterized protein n=1 Tax=Talaromyces thermophilus TaxID=28565 RepID=UPI00374349CE
MRLAPNDETEIRQDDPWLWTRGAIDVHPLNLPTQSRRRGTKISGGFYTLSLSPENIDGVSSEKMSRVILNIKRPAPLTEGPSSNVMHLFHCTIICLLFV